MLLLETTVARRFRPGWTVGFVAFLCLLGALCPWVASADGEEIWIEPAAQAVAVGSEASIAVQISGEAPVYGVELHLRFDPSLLQVVDDDPAREGVQIRGGTLFSGRQTFTGLNRADNSLGIIDYAVTLMGESQGVTEGGSVIVVRFVGRAAGEASIVISEALVADPAALRVTVTTRDGHITVQGSAPVSTNQPTLAASSTPPSYPVQPAATRRPAAGSAPTATRVSPAASPRASTTTSAGQSGSPYPVPASPSPVATVAGAAKTVATSTRASAPQPVAGEEAAASIRSRALPLIAGLAVAIGLAVGAYLWRRGRHAGQP